MADKNKSAKLRIEEYGQIYSHTCNKQSIEGIL